MGYTLLADLDTPPELSCTLRGVLVIFFDAKGVLLLPVKLTLMYETQNKANQIYNKTVKDDPPDVPRNDLYMVIDPQDSKYKVTLQVDIPSTFRTKFYAAAFVGTTKVANSDVAFDSTGKCQLAFTHSSTSNNIENFLIRIGYDANNNGALDSSEAMALPVVDQNSGYVGDATVRGSNSARYSTAKSDVDGIISGTFEGFATSLVLPHAKRFLQIFRDGSASSVPTDKQPTSSPPISFDAFNGYFDEWLTHNAGAHFDDNGVAQISEYTWNSATDTGAMVATSDQIENAVRDYYLNTVNSTVNTYFADKPVGTIASFPPTDQPLYDVPHPSESPSWVPPSTVTFQTSGLIASLDDVNGTIGRGRLLSHQVRYTVQKQHVAIPPAHPEEGDTTTYVDVPVVTGVTSQGEVIDLYDFNFETGGYTGAAQDAAILQIGFGKGAYGSDRVEGNIFRDRIQFNKSYSGLPRYP